MRAPVFQLLGLVLDTHITCFTRPAVRSTKMPVRGPELTPQMRSRICELHSIGLGATKIHARHPEIALSTIKYTLKVEKKRNECVSRPRSGRPPLPPEQQGPRQWRRQRQLQRQQEQEQQKQQKRRHKQQAQSEPPEQAELETHRSSNPPNNTNSHDQEGQGSDRISQRDSEGTRPPSSRIEASPRNEPSAVSHVIGEAEDHESARV